LGSFHFVDREKLTMRPFPQNALLLCACLAGGCAVDVERNSQQAEMVSVVPSGSASQTSGRLIIRDDTPVALPLNFPFSYSAPPLRRNSEWLAVGNIPQGTVYRPAKGVFQVTSGDAHEAFIVVSQGLLAGVYLPVSKAFVELRGEKPRVAHGA
jgi:hypothetical protein